MLDFWCSTQLIKKIQASSLVLCLILTIFGVIFVPVNFALGILAGGIIASFNFYWLQTALRKIFDQQVVFGHKAIYYAKYYLRLGIMGIVLYELIVNKMVHPLGLIIGLSVIVINIMVIAFTELWKIVRTKEAT
ncbi:MAG: ATP synthase subunit I [Thermodesulfobacteriota bacterium]|nr:ATP synthase subunit I [Thermodesulfobacteriota bacterium]